MELKAEISTASQTKLLSFIFWSVSYIWCATKTPHHSPEWCSRVVTLVHGSVATVVGMTQCGIFELTSCRLTMKISLHHYLLMVWSWGYFAFDLLWCLMYWTDSYLMLCHHATALVAINVYMSKDYTGCTFACTLALMEVTNPLLQIRWFLRREGYNQTLIFYVVECVYLVLFLSLRGVLGTYLVIKILRSDIFDMDEKVITLVFYMVSLAFINDIVGYVLYKYKTKIGEFRGFLNEIGIILNEQQ